MQRQQHNNMAAIYLRLSRDDGGDAESNSIQNQRELLQKHASEQGFCVFSEYVDDGISGTTFERRAFKEMVTDIEAGKIGILLCKDLSRLGRHNALVSFYTEIFFFEHNVRFIALNDGIDSAKGDNEIMPFKSVINEYYAKDISKKVKSVKTIHGQQGKHLGGKPPYGYMINPHDKYSYVPDSITAPIVKRMFEMSADVMGAYTIAKTLTEECVPTAVDSWNCTYSGAAWTHSYIAYPLDIYNII